MIMPSLQSERSNDSCTKNSVGMVTKWINGRQFDEELMEIGVPRYNHLLQPNM